MLESSFGLFFFLKQPKNQKNDERYVYLRVTIDGVAREVSTKRIWQESRWDGRAGRPKGNKEDAMSLCAALDAIRTQVYAIKNKLILGGKQVTAAAIKDVLTGKNEENRMLLDLLEIHNKRMESLIGKEYAYNTLKKFKTTLKQTRIFIQSKYGQDDIPISDLNYEFISDFAYWLKTTQNCDQNSVIKYVKNIKKIVLDCIRKGWLQRDPFIGFKLSQKEVQIIPLSQEDLSKIRTKEIAVERLKLVRDIFLFSCYTGLAYVDVRELKHEQIMKGFDGEQWIMTCRRKTETPTRVPLLPQALSIIEEYRNHPRCSEQGYVLPVLTNQKMNAYLKEIADICGVTKRLTFHIARHTFATTVTLGNGVPIETVSKMLGHKNLKQTQHYAKIMDIKISQDMQMLKGKLAASQ